jgi:hypothetical protein
MQLEKSKMSIGYVPYSESLEVPGDRRRFVFYAKEKEITYEVANINKLYDVVYLTHTKHLSDWLIYKQKNPSVKIIYELIDSYILENSFINTYAKGILRYFTKREKILYFNYKKLILSLIKIADAVVCSTQLQKDFLLQHNKNVHISLDFFEDEISVKKIDYTIQKKLKLVWEGQAYTLNNLLAIAPTLNELKDKVELHIITDEIIKYPIKFFNKKSEGVLKKLRCEKFFYNWEKDSFSKILIKCDLAIIPISKKDVMMNNKPENKLLLLWQHQIPVLTTDTPAYKKTMGAAGIKMYCSNNDDWRKSIDNFGEENQTRKMVEQANEYIKQNHSKEIILQNWDNIFKSL